MTVTTAKDAFILGSFSLIQKSQENCIKDKYTAL